MVPDVQSAHTTAHTHAPGAKCAGLVYGMPAGQGVLGGTEQLHCVHGWAVRCWSYPECRILCESTPALPGKCSRHASAVLRRLQESATENSSYSSSWVVGFQPGNTCHASFIVFDYLGVLIHIDEMLPSAAR